VTQVKKEPTPKGLVGLQLGASLLNPKNIAKPQRLHLEKVCLKTILMLEYVFHSSDN
jgi:hypothetical protein